MGGDDELVIGRERDLDSAPHHRDVSDPPPGHEIVDGDARPETTPGSPESSKRIGGRPEGEKPRRERRRFSERPSIDDAEAGRRRTSPETVILSPISRRA